MDCLTVQTFALQKSHDLSGWTGNSIAVLIRLVVLYRNVLLQKAVINDCS